MALLEREDQALDRRLSVSPQPKSRGGTSTRPNVKGCSHPELLKHYAALWETPVSDDENDDGGGNPPPPNSTSKNEDDFSDGDNGGAGYISSDGASTDSEAVRYVPAAGGATLPPSSRFPAPLRYRYTRLFRIQRLYPTLEIELHAFSVDEMPNYVAVSHRWGEEASSTAILCNEEYLVMLKPSLVAAIQNVSQLIGADKWLWVDGISIQQNDEAEKAQQVQLLWKIFGDAESVLIYLGEGDSDSSAAIRAMRNAAVSRSRDIDSRDWTCIHDLLHRAWFTRLWTMQEAIVARQVLIACGEDTLTWDDLAYVYRFVKPPTSRNNYHPTAGMRRSASTVAPPGAIDSPSIGSIITLRRYRTDHHSESDPQYAREILHLMTTQSCFLQIDRIYAVLGLFPPALMAQIDVNYSQERRVEYWTTYHQFCRALLQCFGSTYGPVFNALKDIAERTHSCPGNVPGWCPDFSRLRTKRKVGLGIVEEAEMAAAMEEVKVRETRRGHAMKDDER